MVFLPTLVVMVICTTSGIQEAGGSAFVAVRPREVRSVCLDRGGSDELANVIAIEGQSTEQVSKAMWSGSELVVTTTMAAGDQRRTFVLEGANLAISTSTSGPVPNKLIYKKSRVTGRFRQHAPQVSSAFPSQTFAPPRWTPAREKWDREWSLSLVDG